MDSTDSEELSRRVAALEARIDALQNTSVQPIPAAPGSAAEELPWVLRGLRERETTPGGSVIFAGEVEVGGGHTLYQWQRSTRFLTDRSWDQSVERLGAITHPIRGAILRRLLDAPPRPLNWSGKRSSPPPAPLITTSGRWLPVAGPARNPAVTTASELPASSRC